jgi:hypothetical protein
MKFMMLIKHPESHRSLPVPEGLYEAMDEFVQEGFRSGVLTITSGLKATKEAARVRLDGGKLRVIDGPFTEAKEVVGGFAIVEVKSREQAMELANQVMELHLKYWPAFVGECEVRPFEDDPPQP